VALSNLSNVSFGLLLGFLIAFGGLAFPGQTSADCLACHDDPSQTLQRDGKTLSLHVAAGAYGKSAHGGLPCTSCHLGFDGEKMPHRAPMSAVSCVGCHTNLSEIHAAHPAAKWNLGAQAAPSASCVLCHGKHVIARSRGPGKPGEASMVALCGSCHLKARAQFDESAHGLALKGNRGGAPDCVSCHRLRVPPGTKAGDRLAFRVAQEKLCLACHVENARKQNGSLAAAAFFASYEKSVHGLALLRGNTNAATCIDCHGSHDMKNARDPSAATSKGHLSRTCAKCHPAVAREYDASVHGVASARGAADSPVCTDCHGEHDILIHTDPQARTEVANLSTRVCAPCHSSVKLSKKYDLNSNRSRTFAESFHGLAGKAGSVDVAHCASCHGVHNIRPSKDPLSTIAPGHLAQTCGKCHPGANERFTKGAVHVDTRSRAQPLLYWIATLYLLFIFLVVGGMFFHNLIDFVKKARHELALRRGQASAAPVGTGLYLRMTLSERLQHGVFLLSFVALVLTGFLLKFPEAGWVAFLRDLSPTLFGARGAVHRVAAVLMLGAGLFHLYYVIFVPRGRQLLRDLRPRKKDFADAFAVARFNLGLGKEKPRFGRFSYVEKSEYWALLWGTLVMAATGFILWFDNTFLGLLTKLGWDAARTIHYYEAWLATLSILVWHFYFVILSPGTFPINLAFWKGTLSEKEMREDHPLELEEIEKKKRGN